MEPLLIVDTAMAPMDLFHRLKKYYSGDAGTRPLFSSLAVSPSFLAARGLGLQHHPHHPAMKQRLAQTY
jgi:hypothetical protein